MAGTGEVQDPVRLHLNRRIGWGLYGTATVAVFGFVLVGIVYSLDNGRFAIAAVLLVVGMAIVAFLAFVTQSIVVPELAVTAHGVSGRLSRGPAIDAAWDEVTIDIDPDDDAPGPATLRLVIGERSVSLDSSAWAGFADFVILVGTTADIAARLTPEARQEVIRLLRGGW